MSYTLIKKCTIFNTDFNAEQVKVSDILIEDSKILRILPKISAEDYKDVNVINAEGLYAFPGLIDAHTHFHLVSRGTETADGFENGSLLASYGGVTTVVDFADHLRGKTLTESAEFRQNEMKGKMAVDYTLHQGVYGYSYNSSIPAQLEKLKESGIKTLKIFTTYRETGYLLEDPEKLSDLFKNAGKMGMLVCAHCEYNPLIEKISATWKGTFLPKDHADLRPAEAEAHAIQVYGTYAMKNNCPLYVVHLSSEAGLNEIRKLRKKGAVIYAETTPTYLFLNREKLEGPNGPLYVMTPPLRTKSDNLVLLQGLIDKEIQVVATDHCSYTKTQKLSNPDVRSTFPGIPGIEEMFVLLNTFREKSGGRLSVKDLLDLTSENPAKLFGLYPEKGSLKEGTDADIVLFDPKAKGILNSSNVHTNACYTPYEGFEVNGKISMTMLRGKIIQQNGQYFGEVGQGVFLKQN